MHEVTLELPLPLDRLSVRCKESACDFCLPACMCTGILSHVLGLLGYLRLKLHDTIFFSSL